ncbi:unnamed protein product [Trichobilharzia regenti]|nr:unnamed protein product [Trichobilharzia regenti]
MNRSVESTCAPPPPPPPLSAVIDGVVSTETPEEHDIILSHFPTFHTISGHLIRSGEFLNRIRLDNIELTLVCAQEVFKNSALIACRIPSQCRLGLNEGNASSLIEVSLSQTGNPQIHLLIQTVFT